MRSLIAFFFLALRCSALSMEGRCQGRRSFIIGNSLLLPRSSSSSSRVKSLSDSQKVFSSSFSRKVDRLSSGAGQLRVPQHTSLVSRKKKKPKNLGTFLHLALLFSSSTFLRHFRAAVTYREWSVCPSLHCVAVNTRSTTVGGRGSFKFFFFFFFSKGSGKLLFCVHLLFVRYFIFIFFCTGATELSSSHTVPYNSLVVLLLFVGQVTIWGQDFFFLFLGLTNVSIINNRVFKALFGGSREEKREKKS